MLGMNGPLFSSAVFSVANLQTPAASVPKAQDLGLLWAGWYSPEAAASTPAPIQPSTLRHSSTNSKWNWLA